METVPWAPTVQTRRNQARWYSQSKRMHFQSASVQSKNCLTNHFESRSKLNLLTHKMCDLDMSHGLNENGLFAHGFRVNIQHADSGVRQTKLLTSSLWFGWQVHSQLIKFTSCPFQISVTPFIASIAWTWASKSIVAVWYNWNTCLINLSFGWPRLRNGPCSSSPNGK